MASNMYIKFDDVKGECTDEKHKDWIEVLSWSHSFSQPATSVRGSSGSTIEKCNHSDLSISKYLDSSTDDILKACWSGKQFEKCTMECFRADGDNVPIKYLSVDLEDIIISNVSVSGGGGDLPIENYSLAYSKVTYSYDPQDKMAGAAGNGVQPVSHDLMINKIE